MATAFDKVRFLVVEDNEASVQIVRTLLNAIGAKDIVAERSVAGALRRIESEKLDIVILDLRLGTDDGLDVLKAVRRQDSRHAFLPVLVLSAYTDQTRVEAARDAGATEVCAKPVSPAELYRRLMAMIVEPRPYVRSDGYFGPDRRRRREDEYQGVERRAGSTGEGEKLGATAAVG